ncbi:hypothetical protein Cylst_3468 [Cylindrospermum stagnale PCC 7417]|uniref:Uncharacterized protein n=1 Tax=Cylindrospermum stagnale PCC 7417 TaxID=56107 RepID=K9WZ31_9NOST|nr:hypothetical protein Cylst_3468 [Cylindrospermum stagnale PCC 7417]
MIFGHFSVSLELAYLGDNEYIYKQSEALSVKYGAADEITS